MKINLKFTIHLGLLGILLGSCVGYKVIQKPIIFNEERYMLTKEYLKIRYNIIKETPSIVPRMIVVHWTDIPTMEGTFAAFNSARLPNSRSQIQGASSLNVSSQYLIDQDGSIYQLLPDTIMARHVIGLNHCAIGIENVGNGDDLPLTDAQLKSNLWLIKQLDKKYTIDYVIGHFEYKKFIGHNLWKETDPGYLTDKTDPGIEFITMLRSRLKKLNLEDIPD